MTRRREILEQNGVNTAKFFSLNLNRGMFPPGSVIEINVKDASGNSLYLRQEDMEKKYAENSVFFNKMMMDGCIFNPYIHRRFIAKQFLDMMRINLNVDKQIKVKYSFLYSIEYTLKELNKLLYCMNDAAFEERCLFFTPNNIRMILVDYVDKAIAYLSGDLAWRYPYDCRTKKSHDKEYWLGILNGIKSELAYLYVPPGELASYQRIKECIQYLPVFDFSAQKSAIFVESFKKSGAFYTFKQLVMFEGCVYFKSNDAEVIMNEMKKCVKNEEAYIIYAKLKDLIKINKYKL